MRLTIELDREVDGRWIAEIAELNVLLYGNSREDVIERAQKTAHEILLDRIAHGELPPDSAAATFLVAA
ncbi:MAG: type II toxin-antitoxin system HicB family antitoxin [Acidobacteria bacterium]|nr:type II toxin-antitoxin system HicB family antitoxin [Acidobacteriota bacterium]